MYIKIENLCKSWNTSQIVLKGISTEIEKGKICVILGPSGSGKSTFVNILGGLDKAESGKIWINDENIMEYSQIKLCEYRRDKVGFIFQFYNLIPNLTVKENIEVVTNISNSPLSIDEVLSDIGMTGMEKRFPNELSGGQQQRVAIARALIKNPDILLCDEPTGALDYITSKEVLGLLGEMNRKYNTTIIIITHNNAIAGMAHKTIKIKSGELVEEIINNTPLSAERIEW